MNSPDLYRAEKAFQSDRRYLILLALITCVAAALRFWQCTESLWLDETHTAWAISDGFSQITARAKAGNYGPVYFWLPWLSTRMLGQNEFALRLPSLLAGVCLAPVCFGVARDWFRSPVLGLLAASLVTIDPHSLFYSLDARPYSLVQLLSAIHVWLLVRMLWPEDRSTRRSSKRLWVSFCAVGVVLFQFHFTAGLLFAAETAIVFAALVADRWLGSGCATPPHRPQVLSAIGGLAVIGAFCLTAIGTVRQVASRRELWNQFIERQADFRVIFPWGEYLGTAVFVALACWGIERIAKSRNPPDVDALENATLGARISWAPLIATLVWLILPLSVAFGLTRLDIARLFYRRYAMFSYPALILLTAGVGVILSSRRSKAIYAVLLVLVTCCLIGPQRQFAGDGRFVRHSHEDWRGVTRAVRFSPSLSSHNIDNDSGKQPPPVLVRTGLIEEELSQTPDEIAAASDYLLFPVSSIYPIPNHDVYLLTSDLQMANNAIEHLSKVSRCTLIIRGKKWFESNRDGILKSLAPRLKPRNSTSGPLQLQVVYDGGNVVLAELGPPTTDR